MREGTDLHLGLAMSPFPRGDLQYGNASARVLSKLKLIPGLNLSV